MAIMPRRCETDAAARCRLPRPSGRSISSTDASRYRHAATTMPVSETTKAPSSCASSLTAAQVRVGDVRRRWRVPGQRVQDERARMREHGVGMPESKQRTDPTAFSPLTCDFHREFQYCVKHLAATPLHPRTNAVEYRRGHACVSRTDGRFGETNGRRHIHLTPPPAPGLAHAEASSSQS